MAQCGLEPDPVAARRLLLHLDDGRRVPLDPAEIFLLEAYGDETVVRTETTTERVLAGEGVRYAIAWSYDDAARHGTSKEDVNAIVSLTSDRDLRRHARVQVQPIGTPSSRSRAGGARDRESASVCGAHWALLDGDGTPV
jgi:hypothetical protein